MEYLIRSLAAQRENVGYRDNGIPITVLAYADDVALVSRKPDGMMKLLDLADLIAAWSGLKFNPRKCATLHVAGGRVRATEFRLGGGTPASMAEGESYDYLGIPTGFNVDQTPGRLIEEIVENIDALDASLLAPWQKIEALNMFLLTKLDFILRGDRVRKGPLKIMDKRVKRALKDWIYLPVRASWEICHLDPRKGGAGVFPTADQVDILTVSHAFRLLSSREPWVRALVDSAITKTVRNRTRREPEERDIAENLSGSMRAEFGRYRFDVASLWSDARMASSRLAVKIGMSWNWSDVRREFEIVIPAHGREVDVIRVPPNKARMLGKLLRDAVRHRYLARLLAKPDQGKVFECISASPFSNHFLRTGANTRFCDWRFVHRARLGVVPLNAATRWGPRDDLRCRRCGWQSETLPHVLDHCQVHSSAWRGRHDAILHRLAGEVPRAGVEIRVDRTPPMIDSALRRDLVVVDEGRRKIVIVDVTVPFENRKNALDVARQTKFQKYSSIAQQLADRGYTVSLSALVVGALGAWDPQNWVVFRDLGIAKRNVGRIAKFMISDAIRWSRDIYVSHVTGKILYPTTPALPPGLGTNCSPRNSSEDDDPTF
ncbi:uncharacterized protein T26G10.4-like [Ischnura elegans]|uniref:uncharacterized protein T26G10.4-like n=1 Tax=Ischnura elegans TaxID=197161 RepID=UPI001ED8A2AE|nr:uncharacterized protein T26G10.4-like [Ischnura elegans]